MMCTSNVCLWHRSRRYVVFCNRMNVVVTTDGIVPKCLKAERSREVCLRSARD